MAKKVRIDTGLGSWKNSSDFRDTPAGSSSTGGKKGKWGCGCALLILVFFALIGGCSAMFAGGAEEPQDGPASDSAIPRVTSSPTPEPTPTDPGMTWAPGQEDWDATVPESFPTPIPPAAEENVLPEPAGPLGGAEEAPVADSGLGAYPNCTAVYQAGESHLTPAHPRWKDALDGSPKNGVGCENPPWE